ncbi:MAG: hypothetical protein EOO54_19995 [Haliea sp.]|nr:MAG: hypothetical protein EOO54_19995 [Haliea sp.]
MALKYILGGVAALILAGCSTPVPVPPGPGTAPAGPAAGGLADGASVVEDARQRSGSYMARVLRPNQAVTMEFNAQRLNLDVDSAGVVTRVRCG